MLFDSSLFLSAVESVIDDTFRKAGGQPPRVPKKERAMPKRKLSQQSTLRPTSEGRTKTLDSEQKRKWEILAIPSLFVLYSLNGKEKHYPLPVCFPSRY